MNPRLDQFAKMFNFDSGIFSKALEGVKPEDLHATPNKDCASLLWLAGHLVKSRYYLANLIGASDEYEWSNMFNGDGSPIKDPSDYPSIEEIKKAFEDISKKLMSGFKKLDDSGLDKKLKSNWPQGDDTHFGAISFMCWHEGWHIGQMSVLRKQLGYKGLAG